MRSQGHTVELLANYYRGCQIVEALSEIHHRELLRRWEAL
jgi:hypothetical protein